MVNASVRVLCRCRPPNSRERLEEAKWAEQGGGAGSGAGQQNALSHLRMVSPQVLELRRDPRTGVPLPSGTAANQFVFDAVFSPAEFRELGDEDTLLGDSQRDVFDRAAHDTVDDVLQGFHGTIFVYGQTGSGKTHTMFGSLEDALLSGSGAGAGAAGVGGVAAAAAAAAGAAAGGLESWGVIPRSIKRIFDYLEVGGEPQGPGLAPLYPPGTEFVVKCSFLEVYKEIVRDLLSVEQAKSGLRVRENPTRGVWVDGLSEHCVSSLEEALDLIRLGERSRATSATGMNATSSRSHSLFIIQLQQRFPDGSSRSARLNLADLAGSEKVGKTGASGQTLEEAKKINQSLSALGNCISALSKGSGDRRGHIPYRDSKLTHILRESLGGNCKTTLLITISPHWFNVEETISTLKFGLRAKAIKNEVKQNVQRSVAELNAIIKRLTRDLERERAYTTALEGELRAARGADFDFEALRATTVATASESAADQSAPSAPGTGVPIMKTATTAAGATASAAGDPATPVAAPAGPRRSRSSTLLEAEAAVQLEQRAETAELEASRIADELEAALAELEEQRELSAALKVRQEEASRSLAKQLEEAEILVRRVSEERDGKRFELEEASIVHRRDKTLLKETMRSLEEEKGRRRTAERSLRELEDATGVREAGIERRPLSTGVSPDVKGPESGTGKEPESGTGITEAIDIDTATSSVRRKRREMRQRRKLEQRTGVTVGGSEEDSSSSSSSSSSDDASEAGAVAAERAESLALERQLHEREVQLLRDRIAELEALRTEERTRADETHVRLVQTQTTLAESMNAHLEELSRRDALLALHKKQSVQRPVVASRAPRPKTNAGSNDGATPKRAAEAHFSPFHVFSLKFSTRQERQRTRESLGAAMQEGYLMKQGGLMRNWQRRWFVVKGEHMYYYSGADCQDQKGVVPLDDCQVRALGEDENKGRNFSFGVFHASRRTFLLQAESQLEMDQWIAAIERSTADPPRADPLGILEEDVDESFDGALQEKSPGSSFLVPGEDDGMAEVKLR